MTEPIELRPWIQFLAVAELLHFSRAARQLHMTQPPLTQAIQKLEERLGYALFERTRRTVALTPAGAALVEPVRELLRAAGALPAVGRDAAAGVAGRLRLGFVSTVGFELLPTWLRSFRQTHPRIGVQLREATSDVQLEALQAGSLDAGLVVHAPGMAPATTASLELRQASVGIEPLLLALPRHLVHSKHLVDLRAILAQPLVIFPRESAPSLYDSIFTFCHRLGITPQVAQEAIQMQTIVNLVGAGLGIAFVPRVVSRFRRAGVAYRPLPRQRRASVPRAETSLVWTRDPAPSVARFVSHVTG